MKNYKFIPALLVFFFAMSVFNVNSFSREKDNDKPYMKKIEMKLKKKNAVFNLNLDIQVGANISSTSIELNKPDTTNSVNTTSTKVGPSAGFIFAFDFLGFGFSTGFQFASKGFKQQNGENYNMNYFNIPMLIYFDFPVGKKVLIDGNIGPYVGILMSQTAAPTYGVKNFDFGITGALQGAYMLNDYMGPLLGVKYEFGGLNNLGSSENIKSIRTSTIFIYTGFKFVI